MPATVSDVVWKDASGKEYRAGDTWTDPSDGYTVEVAGPHWPPHRWFYEPEDENAIVIESINEQGEFDSGMVGDQLDFIREMWVVVQGTKTAEQARKSLEWKWGLEPASVYGDGMEVNTTVEGDIQEVVHQEVVYGNITL